MPMPLEIFLPTSFACFFPLQITINNKTYNRRQKQSRHFALKGLPDILLNSKGENKAFPLLHRPA